MKVLVGLGNPGSQYALTRHNVGFLCVDALAESYDFPPFKEKFQGALTQGHISGEKVLIFKPLTYMNLSGKPTQKLCQFYQIPPDHVFVFHDDLDLIPGKIRVKQGGGAGGHNGLKSLDVCMTPNYWRIKIGIGRPPHPGMSASDYVLERFSAPEIDDLAPLIQDLCRNIGLLFSDDPQKLGAHLMQNKSPQQLTLQKKDSPHGL